MIIFCDRFHKFWIPINKILKYLSQIVIHVNLIIEKVVYEKLKITTGQEYGVKMEATKYDRCSVWSVS